MAESQAELVKKLVDAGVHFGHRASRWNPKMQPYIHGKRNTIHIIDIRETLKGLLRAKKFVQNVVAAGGDIVFVGTKRQSRFAVVEEANRSGMHYVSQRWLGGTLTNFRTIRARLNRLEELEKLFETGAIESYSKKMKSTLKRELDKIKSNLEGIRRMERIPAALFIIDTRREHIAVKEARKMGIPTLALIDTDGDPTNIDLPIPGNDDSMKAIELICHELAEAAIAGKAGRTAKSDGDNAQAPHRRRSSRAAFRAEQPQAAGSEAESPAESSEPAQSAPSPAPAVPSSDEAVNAG